jgi:hypothetical protein
MRSWHRKEGARASEAVIDGVVVVEDSYVRSGEEERGFMPAHPDTLAIPGHDRELWPRLGPTHEPVHCLLAWPLRTSHTSKDRVAAPVG